MLVGVISLSMAYKNLMAMKLNAFNEQAAEKSWNELGEGIQAVLIALMRVSGLGFLVVGLMLIFFPLVNLPEEGSFVRYGVPLISFLYCIGLAVVNYRLYIQTRVETPWKRSIYAAAVIAIALIVSLV